MAQRTNFPDQMLSAALPALDALIMTEYNRYPDIVPKLYDVKGSTRWGEQTTTMAGLGAVPEKDEGAAVTFDDPIEGYDKTFTHLTYALAVSFTEELIEDDRLDMVQKTYRSLGLAMYQTRQIQAASVFNNGFAVDTGPDGSYLFATDHTLIGGGDKANRPSTDIAISVAGLREMEIDMMNQTNHRNINIMVMPRMVCIPPDLKHVTKELLKSTDRPDTANRAINTFYDENYETCISPFFTSATAWWTMADKAVCENRWYERVSPTTKSWEDEKTGSVNTKVRCRFSNGYSDWIGMWGTTG